MTAAPLSPPADQDDAFFRAALRELVEIGTALARDIQAARESQEITIDEAAEAFERVARATRRTVLLATRCDGGPGPEAPGLPARRRQLIRAVEDAITRDDAFPTAESKHRAEAEFRERLDRPELAEDLAARPVAEVVETILRDMDIGRLPFSGRGYRRRTPDAVARLHALARGEPVALCPDPHVAEPPRPPGPGEDGPALLALHRLILAGTAPPGA